MAERGADDQADRVVAAKDELYGLPLGKFTAARTERAKQAAAAGNRDAAAVIAKLPKPNVVAWLANQLARRDPGELRPLLELGESLRRATARLDAAQLSQLSRQQRQIVSDLTGRARELAGEAGQAVSDGTVRGLEDTLHAALADEQAAQDLIRGQLAAGLSHTGFPGLDAAAESAAALAAPAQRQDRSAAPGKPGRSGGSRREAATASADAPSPTAHKTASDRRAQAARAAAEAHRQQLERARRVEADARADAAEADRDQDQARTALTDADSAARQAEDAVSRLQNELDAALDARNNTGRAQRQARKDTDRADRTARQVERRLTEATARREELERDA